MRIDVSPIIYEQCYGDTGVDQPSVEVVDGRGIVKHTCKNKKKETDKVEDETLGVKVEDETLGVFVGLYEIADRTSRKEIRNALVFTQGDHSPSPKKYTSSSSLNSSRVWEDSDESSFLKRDLVYPSQSASIVRDFINTLADIVFGWQVFRKEGQKPNQELEKLSKTIKNRWELVCKKHYSKDYHQFMDRAINKAGTLIRNRKDDQIKLMIYRVNFYAGLCISILGKLYEQKVLAVIGLSFSIIFGSFTVKRYIDSSFKERDCGTDLIIAINHAYNLANGKRFN